MKNEVEEMKRIQKEHIRELEMLRQEMKRQRTENREAIEQTEDKFWDMIHEQAKEHSKQWSQRRHTGSKSSAWHDKKCFARRSMRRSVKRLTRLRRRRLLVLLHLSCIRTSVSLARRVRWGAAASGACAALVAFGISR